MTGNGDPLGNAITERVKGILKSKWLSKRMPETKLAMHAGLAYIILSHNHKWLHRSIDICIQAASSSLKGRIQQSLEELLQDEQN